MGVGLAEVAQAEMDTCVDRVLAAEAVLAVGGGSRPVVVGVEEVDHEHHRA